MALGLTPEHLELAAAVRGWSKRHCPENVVGAIADADDGGAERYRAELAPALAELGLFGLHLAEADGGQGFGLPELAVALEELGRAMLPGAFLPTVLASAVLAEAAAENRAALASDATVTKLIARLADGSLSGAVCLATGLTGTRNHDGGLMVGGEAGPVLGGPLADLIIAPVATDQGEAWVALGSADLVVAEVTAVDLARPLATISGDGINVPAERVLAGIDQTAVVSLAAILFGAEACGIADWAVQTATDYANTPGSITPTCTTAARSRCAPSSARRDAGASGSQAWPSRARSSRPAPSCRKATPCSVHRSEPSLPRSPR